ncbi:RNA polymerase sigma factor [Nonomuraea pusilla]|uniref:RNA polymerase sigma-70 factor, ECF subfamily n=1 Tax=Nonomuraea pusilla TaxID=46177 RepID=A0A1H7Q409_9ACTN|nr:sigma-70 family RNA polymerase sigma factor [Nonomuraea pusilla]SEL42569.1 RNA polymerase sigma-70 factor, ECF subfamily [Nonomuraea pusilla]
MSHHDRKQRFEVIYVANYADILAYVRRRTDSHEDAADALAETFATAWRRLDDIAEGRDARLWLFGVARRVLANGRRAESRRSDLVERLGHQLAVWAEHTEAGESRAGVQEAFARLSPGDREILALAGWEGLRPDEIATVLGCSRANTRLRLHRARKRLARHLDAAGVDMARIGLRAVAMTKGVM